MHKDHLRDVYISRNELFAISEGIEGKIELWSLNAKSLFSKMTKVYFLTEEIFRLKTFLF